MTDAETRQLCARLGIGYVPGKPPAPCVCPQCGEKAIQTEPSLFRPQLVMVRCPMCGVLEEGGR